MWNVDTEWKVKTAPQNHVWSVTLAISSTSCTACNCTKCWLIQIYLAVLVLTNSNLPLGNEPLMPSKAFSPACKMLLVALNCIFFLFRNALSAAPKALFCALKYTFSCTEAFFFFCFKTQYIFLAPEHACSWYVWTIWQLWGSNTSVRLCMPYWGACPHPSTRHVLLLLWLAKPEKRWWSCALWRGMYVW